MALNGLGLGFLFTATDLASGVMDTVSKSLGSLEQASGKTIEGLDDMIGKLGTGLTAAAMGAGGLVTSFGLAGKAASFEQAIADVAAVTGASADELQKFREAALAAGLATKFSPTEAVLGINELAQAGYNATKSVELLNPVLSLAAASLGELSPQDAAGLASQALKAFGIDSSLAGRAMDQLLTSSAAFSVKSKDLLMGLGTVSGGAQTMNQSLTESLLAFGLVKNIIPGTERAATSVKVAMERMANPEVQKALKAQGVSVLDAEGNYRRFFDIIQDLMPAMAKLDEGTKGAFLVKNFGEGLGGLNAIFAQLESGVEGADGVVRKGSEALSYLKNMFTNANGVAKKVADTSQNTFEGSQNLLGGALETLAITVGDPFKDMFRPVIDATRSAVIGVIEVLNGMSPEVKSFFAQLFTGASALLLLGGGILLVQAATPLVVAGFAALTGAVGSFAVAIGSALLAAWPFVLAGLAIAATVAAIAYAIENNIGGIGDAWTKLKSRFSATADGIFSIFTTVWNYVSGAWDAIGKGFNAVFVRISPVFKEIGGAFDFFGKAIGQIGKVFSSTASGPGVGFLSIFELIGNVLGWVLGFVMKLIKWTIYLVSTFIMVAAAIGQAFRPVLDFIIKAIVWVIEKIGKAIDLARKFWGGDSSSSGERGVAPLPEDSSFQPQDPSMFVSEDVPKPVVVGPSSQPVAAASAAEAAAAAEAMGASQASYEPIDYDKLAASLSSQPINVNLVADGEKLASVVARGQRSSAARSSGRDYSEDSI